jgi:hypothetical protein
MNGNENGRPSRPDFRGKLQASEFFAVFGDQPQPLRRFRGVRGVMNVPCLISALLLASLAAPVSAQGGYTTEKHPEHGLTFPRARHYEALPTQPTEEWIVLRFAEKKSQARKKGRRQTPQMWIVRIDHQIGTNPERLDDEERPPRSFDDYVESQLEKWEKGEALDVEEKQGWMGSEYLLENKKGLYRTAFWSYVWEKKGARTFAIMGVCSEADFDKEVKVWRHTASRMKFDEPTAANADRERVKWERHYARRNFIDVEHRISVRLSLTDGWKAEDTENYIVVYDTRDQPLLRRVLRDLEIIRKEYEKLFPSIDPVSTVSTVRVCKDRTEYMQYGGSSGSAGYWSVGTEELVLFDGTKMPKGERKDRHDTFIVLYHEAFHQYIHYSAGELSPHSWYNEGNGDYFSGALISNGKMRKIGPNPWRVARIKYTVEGFDYVPWRQIIRYEQKEYYDNPYVCYAQGWSMVYFLNTSKVARKNTVWSQILPTYFAELKRAWGAELLLLDAAGKLDNKEERKSAQERAREKAVDKAFSDVDLREIEKAWIAFVEDL